MPGISPCCPPGAELRALHVLSAYSSRPSSQADTVITPTSGESLKLSRSHSEWKPRGRADGKPSSPAYHPPPSLPYLVCVLTDFLIETFHHPPKMCLKLRFYLFTAMHIEKSENEGGSPTPLSRQRLSAAMTQAVLLSRPAGWLFLLLLTREPWPRTFPPLGLHPSCLPSTLQGPSSRTSPLTVPPPGLTGSSARTAFTSS